MARINSSFAQGSAYSVENFNTAGWDQQDFYVLLGHGLIDNPKFEVDSNGHSKPIRGSVESRTLEVYIAGICADKVKLPADYELPILQDMSLIRLINPTAYVNRYGNYYFRAEGVIAAND